MPLFQYRATDTFWAGTQGCVNEVPLTTTFIADDSSEPFTLIRVYRSSSGCGQVFTVGVRDKNNQVVITNSGCFNNSYNCGRLGNTDSGTITKLGRVYVPSDPDHPSNIPPPPPPTKYACLNGQCALDHRGVFDTLAECQAVCRPIDGSPCNCPPPSICFSSSEVNTLRKALNRAKKNLLTDLLGGNK